MPKKSVVGYIRVSSDKQNVDSQKLSILDYCDKNRVHVDNWIKVKISSKKSAKKRRIDELLTELGPGDTLVVSELSRLARSVGQIAVIVDKLIAKKIHFICIKENIHLHKKHDIQTKTMITMFSLFAEIERDLISLRTIEGLERARAAGKKLGRPLGEPWKIKA